MKPVHQDRNLLAQHEIAADWYLRRNASDWSDADEQAFLAWQASDPQHARTYAQLQQTWLDLGQVPRPQPARAPSPAAAPRPAAARAGKRWPQWRPLALAAGLALVLAGWLAYGYLPLYRLDVATSDTIRKLELPDGSRIAVNQHSTLAVRLYAGRREVELKHGEAFFEVSHNPQRPFTVLSGPGEVRVVGTVFDVQASNSGMVVKVREGRVEVRPDARIRERFTTLVANDGLALDDSPGGGERFHVSPDMVGDWRSGQLVFRASPLASVAGTLAHYLGQPVQLADPALGRLAVSGYVATNAPAAFLESLPDLLPVKVSREAGGGYRISAR